MVKSITLDASRYKSDVDQWVMPDNLALVTYSRYGRATLRFAVGFVGPDGMARREYEGPKLPGPWAYMFPLATVISAHPQPRESVVEVATGEVVDLVAGGRTFRFVVTDERRMHYPDLVLVPAGEVAAAGGADRG